MQLACSQSRTSAKVAGGKEILVRGVPGTTEPNHREQRPARHQRDPLGQRGGDRNAESFPSARTGRPRSEVAPRTVQRRLDRVLAPSPRYRPRCGSATSPTLGRLRWPAPVPRVPALGQLPTESPNPGNRTGQLHGSIGIASQQVLICSAKVVLLVDQPNRPCRLVG
jgi:hypothetical protein